jgi:XRE family aerobic/anaerobic benzoate catabolism transcriptional regulator
MPINGNNDKQALSRLGQGIRSARKERKLSLRELAKRSGLSERFLSDVESGRANMSVISLLSVAEALGVKASDLLVSNEKAEGAAGVTALLGLRGAGKSTVGRALGEKLGLPFFELDRLVEAKAGMKLSEIFAFHGEDYYRRLELEVLRSFLAEHPRAILATGGGVVTSPQAYRLLSERTRTVWLKAAPEEHWQRVVRQGDLRPIENRPEAMTELKRRLREREPLYARARITCSTSGRPVTAVVDELARQLSP